MTRKHDMAEWWNTVRLCLIGGCVLAIVFLTPNAGHEQHRSFLAVARDSLWSQFADWPAAWCSVKILLLGTGALLVLDAMGNLMIRLKQEVLGLGLFCLGLVPVLLLIFGSYELVKALL
jgi:hypothetical protein